MEQQLVLEGIYACTEQQGCMGIIGGVDHRDVEVGEIKLHMQWFASLLDGIERRLGVEIRVQNLPGIAGPCGLGHPEEASAIRRPEMCVHAFENRAVIDVVEHLGLALEIFQAQGSAEL